jgi:hypothetical protein
VDRGIVVRRRRRDRHCRLLDRRPEGAGARRFIATRSVFYPTERTMGWNVVDSGFKIVLSPAIPKLVREHIGSGTRCLGSETSKAYRRFRSLYRRSYVTLQGQRAQLDGHDQGDPVCTGAYVVGGAGHACHAPPSIPDPRWVCGP